MFILSQFFQAKKLKKGLFFVLFTYILFGFFLASCKKKKPKQTLGRYGSDLRESATKHRLSFNVYTVIDEQDQKQLYFPFEKLRSNLPDLEKHQAIFRGQHKANASGQYLESHPAMYPTYELINPKIPVFTLSEAYFSDLSEGLLIFDVFQKESPVADYELTDAFFFEKNYANGRVYNLKAGTRANTKLRVLSGEVLDRNLAHQGKEQAIGFKTFIFIDSYDEDYQHGISALGYDTENILVVLRDKQTGELVYEAGTIHYGRVELDILIQDYSIEMLMGGSGSLRASEVIEIAEKPVKFLYEDLKIAKYFGTNEEDLGIGRIDIEVKKIGKFLPTSDKIKVLYQKITPTQKAISELDGNYTQGLDYLVLPKKPTELECNSGISFIETGFNDYWIVPKNGQIQCLGDKYEALLNNLIIYQKLRNDTERRIGVSIDITDDEVTGEEMRKVKTLTPPGLDVKGATIRKIYISHNATVAIGQVPPTLESYWWSQEVANQKTHAIDGDVKIFVRSYDKKKISVYHIDYELLISSGELEFISVEQKYPNTYIDPVKNFLGQLTDDKHKRNQLMPKKFDFPDDAEPCHTDINDPFKVTVNKVAKTSEYKNALVNKGVVTIGFKIPAGLSVFVRDPNSGEYNIDLLAEEVNLENSRTRTIDLTLQKGFTANGGKLKTEKLDGSACYYNIEFLYQDDEALLNKANIISIGDGQKVLGTVISGSLTADKVIFEKTPPISEKDHYYTISQEISRKIQDSPGVLVYNDGAKVELDTNPFTAYNYNGGNPKKIEKIVVFSEDREHLKEYDVEFVLASFNANINNLLVSQKDNNNLKFTVALSDGPTQELAGGVKKTFKTITIKGVNKRLETLGEKVLIKFDLPQGAAYGYDHTNPNTYTNVLPQDGLAVENGKKLYVVAEDTYHLAEHEIKFEYLADQVSPATVEIISSNTRSKSALKTVKNIVWDVDRYVAKIEDADFDKGIRVQKFNFNELLNKPVSELSFGTENSTDLATASFFVIENNESIQTEPVYFYAEDGTKYPFYVEPEFKLDINFLSGNIATNSIVRVNDLTKNNFIELNNFISKGWDLSKIKVILKLDNNELIANFDQVFVVKQNNNNYQLTDNFLENLQELWADLPISITQAVNCTLSLFDENQRVLASNNVQLFNGINQIYDLEDLKNLAIFPKQAYKLENNFSDVSDFSPIEHKKLNGTVVYFDGKLDGNSKTLSNFKITKTTSNKNKFGLFAELGDKSHIKNLRLDKFIVEGNDQVGALAGVAKGHIEAVDIINAQVKGNNDVGVLVGFYDNGENNIFVRGIEVKNASIEGTGNVGGLIGSLEKGQVQYNKIQLNTLTGNSNLGGIIGLLNNGSVLHNMIHYFGNNLNVNLFIGQANNNGTLENSYGIGVTNQLFPVNINTVRDVVAYHQTGTNVSPVYYQDKQNPTDLSLLQMKNKIFELVKLGNVDRPNIRGKIAPSTLSGPNTQIFFLEKEKKPYPIIGSDQLPTLWWDDNITSISSLTSVADCSLAGVEFSFSPTSGVGDQFVVSPTNYQNLTDNNTKIQITVTAPANYVYNSGHLQVASSLRNQTKQYVLDEKPVAGVLELKRIDLEGSTCPVFSVFVGGASFSVQLTQGADQFFGAPNPSNEIHFSQKLKPNVKTSGNINYTGTEDVKIKRSTGNNWIDVTLSLVDIVFIESTDTLKEIQIGNNPPYTLHYTFKNDLPKLEQVTIIQNSVLFSTTQILNTHCSTYDVANCGIEFNNLKLGSEVKLIEVKTALESSLTNPALNTVLTDGRESSLTNFVFTTLDNNSIKITSEDGSTTYIYPLILNFDDNRAELIVETFKQEDNPELNAVIKNQVANNYMIEFSKVNQRLLNLTPAKNVTVDFEIPTTAKLSYNYLPMDLDAWNEVTDFTNYEVRHGEKFRVVAMDGVTRTYYTASFDYMKSNPNINEVKFKQGSTISGFITTDKVIFKALSTGTSLEFGDYNPAISVIENTTTWSLHDQNGNVLGTSTTLPPSNTVIENNMYITTVAEDGTEKIYTIILEYQPNINVVSTNLSAGIIDTDNFHFDGLVGTTYTIILTVDNQTTSIDKTVNTQGQVTFSILDFINATPALNWNNIADQDNLNLNLNFEIKTGTFSLGTQIKKVTKSQYSLTTANDVLGIRHNLQGAYTFMTEITAVNLTQPLASGNTAFSGTINGNGHTLTYTLNQSYSGDLYGLFAKTNGAEIKALNVSVNNLGVLNNNNAKVGGLIAEAVNTTISMVSVNTSGLKGHLAGGLVAELSGTSSIIEHSSALNAVMNAQNGGGLVGYARGNSIVRYSYASNSDLKAGAGLIYLIDNSVQLTDCFVTSSGGSSSLLDIITSTNDTSKFKDVYGLLYQGTQYTITEIIDASTIRQYKQNEMSINDFHNKIQNIKPISQITYPNPPLTLNTTNAVFGLLLPTLNFNSLSIVAGMPFPVLWWQGGDMSGTTKIPDLRLADVLIKKDPFGSDTNPNNFYRTSTEPVALKNVQNGETIIIFLPKSEYGDTDPSLTAGHLSPRLATQGASITTLQSVFDPQQFTVTVADQGYSAIYNIKVIFVKDLITALKVKQDNKEYEASVNPTTGEISFPNVRFAPNLEIDIVAMKAGAKEVKTAKLIYQNNDEIDVIFTNQNATLSAPYPKFNKNNPIVKINGGTEQTLTINYKDEQAELKGLQVTNDGLTYTFKRVTDQSTNLYFENLDLTKTLQVSVSVNFGSTWIFGTWNNTTLQIDQISNPFNYDKDKSYRLKITAEDGSTNENFVVYFINKLTLKKVENTPNQLGLKDVKQEYFELEGAMNNNIKVELNHKTNNTEKYTQTLNPNNPFSVYDLLLDISAHGVIKKVEDGSYDLKASYDYILEGVSEFVTINATPQDIQLALRNITTPEDFTNMGLMNYAGVNYSLNNPLTLDLNSILFDVTKPFLANFDGKANTIQYQANYTTNTRTLFGATKDATIKNILLYPGFGIETVNTAGLVGTAEGGSLENIQVTFNTQNLVSAHEMGGLVLNAKGNVQIRKSFVNDLVVRDVEVFGNIAANAEVLTAEGFWANSKIESVATDGTKLGFLIGEKTNSGNLNLTGAYSVMQKNISTNHPDNIVGAVSDGMVTLTEVYGLLSDRDHKKVSAIGHQNASTAITDIGVLDIKINLVGRYEFLKPAKNWTNFFNTSDNLPQFSGVTGQVYGDTRIKTIAFKGQGTTNVAPSSMVLEGGSNIDQADLVGLETGVKIKIYQTENQLITGFDPRNPEHLIITRNSTAALEKSRNCSSYQQGLYECRITIEQHGDLAIYDIVVILPTLEIEKIVITQNNIDIELDKQNSGLFKANVKETYPATIKSITMVGGVTDVEFILYLNNQTPPSTTSVKNISPNNLLKPQNTEIYNASTNIKLEKILVGSVEVEIDLKVLSSNVTLEGITLTVKGANNSASNQFFPGTRPDINRRYFINAPVPDANKHTLEVNFGTFKGGFKIYENYNNVGGTQQEIIPQSGVYVLEYSKNNQYTMVLTSEDEASTQAYPLHIYPRIQATFDGRGTIDHPQYRAGLGDIANTKFLTLDYVTPPNETPQKVSFTEGIGTVTDLTPTAQSEQFSLAQLLSSDIWKGGTTGSTAALDVSFSSTIPNINCGSTTNCNQRIIDITVVQGTVMQYDHTDTKKPILNLKFDIPNIKNIYDLQGLSAFENMTTATLHTLHGGTIKPTSFKGKVVGDKGGRIDDNSSLTKIENLVIDCAGETSCGIFKELPKSVKHLEFDQISFNNRDNISNVGIIAGTATINSTVHDVSPIVQNVIIKNSTITGANNVGTFIGEVKGDSNNKTILSHVISSANKITGNSAVGGLVGKTTGGTYTILGALADVVTTNTSKGGLLFGEAIGNSNVFRLNNVQAIGTLKGNGTQIGGAIGLISNASGNQTVLERIITLPKFDGITGTFADKKVGLFAGEFSGMVNTNGSNNGYQNHRIYSSPSVDGLSLEGTKVKLTNKTRENEERGWSSIYKPNQSKTGSIAKPLYIYITKSTTYGKYLAPWFWYHTPSSSENLVQEHDTRLYSDGKTKINNGLNAPMYNVVGDVQLPNKDYRWHVNQVATPINIDQESTQCQGYQHELKHRASSVFAINSFLPASCQFTRGLKAYAVRDYVNTEKEAQLSVTYNSFPLKKFGTQPISEVVVLNHSHVASLYNEGKMYYSANTEACGTQLAGLDKLRNFYPYLTHHTDIIAEMQDEVTDFSVESQCKSLRDAINGRQITGYQFEDLSKLDRLWIDNYPEKLTQFSNNSVLNSLVLPTSGQAVVLKFLNIKAFSVEINNLAHQEILSQ